MSNLPVPAHRLADLTMLVEEVDGYEAAVELGQSIVALQDRADFEIKFALGDLANKAVADGDYDTLKAFSEAIGVHYSSIKRHAATSKAWPSVSREAGVGYRVFEALNADPNRRETLATIMAELPDGSSPTVMRAREARAEQLEIRTQATASAHARPQAAVMRHGAEPGNDAEQAMATQSTARAARTQDYVPPADDDVNWDSADGWVDPAESEWTAVPTPSGPVEVRTPAPRFRGGQSLESVTDVLAALDTVAEAIACFEGLGEREGDRIFAKLVDVEEMVSEVRRSTDEQVVAA